MSGANRETFTCGSSALILHSLGDVGLVAMLFYYLFVRKRKLRELKSPPHSHLYQETPALGYIHEVNDLQFSSDLSLTSGQRGGGTSVVTGSTF